jgi:hypothetical protein
MRDAVRQSLPNITTIDGSARKSGQDLIDRRGLSVKPRHVVAKWINPYYTLTGPVRIVRRRF